MNLSVRKTTIVVFVILLASILSVEAQTSFNLLVFSKTAGFHHSSIPNGIAMIQQLGGLHNFTVTATENGNLFSDSSLSQFQAVVFLNTTGDVLDENQQAAFESYIRGGRGFVGIHSASDTEYGWPWYGGLIGAYFASHPAIQQARIDVGDHSHPSTDSLPTQWIRTDEWYNFQMNPRPFVHVLATLNESTYIGGTMGDHPISWYQFYDGGRSWYTGMGHTEETYDEPLFRAHVLGAIEWAAGRRTVVSINENVSAPVSGFNLFQNYPNPFNPLTTITFEIEKPLRVTLKIYNVLGQEVTTLFEGRLEPGPQKMSWDAFRFPSGVYFVRLMTGEFISAKKMLLTK